MICTCKYCGKQYKPKASNRVTYCSRECCYADRKANAKKKVNPVCIVCGKEFEGRTDAKYCTDECYKTYLHNKYLEYKQTDYYKDDLKRQREQYSHKPQKELKCGYCGNTYTTSSGNSKYCSPECASKAYYSSETKKEERRRYRARKTNAYVAPVNTNDIYIRDKGMCQICNKKIDRKLKAPHPMSLSLDHIIPLSCGGTHEPKNVQLAHFICNSIKSNESTEYGEQLRIC